VLVPAVPLVDTLMARFSGPLVINQICLCGFTDEKIKGRRHENPQMKGANITVVAVPSPLC
jgi:hypothetical protein